VNVFLYGCSGGNPSAMAHLTPYNGRASPVISGGALLLKLFSRFSRHTEKQHGILLRFVVGIATVTLNLPLPLFLPQVIHLLDAMGLKQHHNFFMQERINGEILLECDDKILERELKVRPPHLCHIKTSLDLKV